MLWVSFDHLVGQMSTVTAGSLRTHCFFLVQSAAWNKAGKQGKKSVDTEGNIKTEICERVSKSQRLEKEERQELPSMQCLPGMRKSMVV